MVRKSNPPVVRRIEIPKEIEEVARGSECSICLPFGLSIVEIDRILAAIRGATGASNFDVTLSKGAVRKIVGSPTPFEIMGFVFDAVYALPTMVCRLAHEPSRNMLIWDDDERFALIAGSRAFCEIAYPHTYDVLEYCFVQSLPGDYYEEKALLECFASLTTPKFGPTGSVRGT